MLGTLEKWGNVHLYLLSTCQNISLGGNINTNSLIIEVFPEMDQRSKWRTANACKISVSNVWARIHLTAAGVPFRSTSFFEKMRGFDRSSRRLLPEQLTRKSAGPSFTVSFFFPALCEHTHLSSTAGSCEQRCSPAVPASIGWGLRMQKRDQAWANSLQLSIVLVSCQDFRLDVPL